MVSRKSLSNGSSGPLTFSCLIFDVALLTTGFTNLVKVRVLLNARGVVILSSDCFNSLPDSIKI